MEKSIESIWKEGFLKSDSLVAPRVNDLYSQKSINLIEKIKKMMNINLIAILVFSVVVLIWWYFMDVLGLGLFVFLLLNGFAFYAKLQMNRLQDVDRGKNSYDYLMSFNNWLKSSLDKNAALMRYFYPLIFTASVATIWFSNDNAEFLREAANAVFPNALMLAGIPVWLLIPVFVIAMIMYFFAGKIYKWDVDLVYGRVFRKLDEIIADMDELRA